VPTETGNLIVDPGEGVRCVLDWEIARIGDPMHDLGVLCMRSWRFGGKGEVGGFGSLLILETNSAPIPQRDHSYELFARHVFPACFGQRVNLSPVGFLGTDQPFVHQQLQRWVH
jgi:hypothetical protein